MQRARVTHRARRKQASRRVHKGPKKAVRREATAGTPRRRLPPDERRAELLRSAIKVFADRGIERAVHADVARAADASVPTVFHYFPTRDALVDVVLDEVERFYGRMTRSAHARRTPAPQVLREHLTAFVGSVDARPAHARVWLDWSTAIGGSTWPRILDSHERALKIVQATIRRGKREGDVPSHVNPEDAAMFLLGAGYMLMMVKLTGRRSQRVARYLNTLVNVALGMTRTSLR